jgi:hypothetical protein
VIIRPEHLICNIGKGKRTDAEYAAYLEEER